MFAAWGRIAYRYRRIVPVIVLAAIMLLYLVGGTQLQSRLSQEGWDDPGSSSTHAAKIELATFGRDNSGDVILLFNAGPSGTIDDRPALEAMSGFLAHLKSEYPQQIEKITAYSDTRAPALATPDRKHAFAAIGLRGDGEQTLKDFRTIKDALTPPGGALLDGTTVEIAGATAIADALDHGMTEDIHRAEVYALPAVAILLVLVFGSIVAAGMPLIVGVLSIAGSLGILSFLALFTQVNVFAQSVITLLGLGLAIDYGLFMVSRFREELAAGRTVKEAVPITTATAGKTVLFSAGMVAVALSGLFVFPQAFLKSIAYGAISAVLLAALLSLTVLPSLFSMLGSRIDLLSIRRKKTRATVLTPEDTRWGTIPRWAMRHSKGLTLTIAAGLLALAIPIAGVSFGGLNETYLPPQQPARVAQEHFDREFPTFRTDPVKLVVTHATNQQLVRIYREANAVPGLTGRFSASETINGTTVLSAGIRDRADNEKVVNALRALPIPEGVDVYIGGTPALEVESIEALFDKLPAMAIYILIATFILMSLVFGSLVLPAKAIIMTVLGMGATIGILTGLFVFGIGHEFLGFSPGPLMSPVLVLIMVITYGLSTDYEVFLVSRMVEAKERGATTDAAITTGTARTGSIITAAAIIMIVVSGAFGFSHIVIMKYIAFGMIAALLLDATILRMLMVPAVMHLLRDDCWWAPQPIKKISAWLGHAATDTHVDQSEKPAVMPGYAASAVSPHPGAIQYPPDHAVSMDTAGGSPEDTRDRRIDEVAVINAEIAQRGGRTTATDETLIPFETLKHRLRNADDGNC